MPAHEQQARHNDTKTTQKRTPQDPIRATPGPLESLGVPLPRSYVILQLVAPQGVTTSGAPGGPRLCRFLYLIRKFCTYASPLYDGGALEKRRRAA